MSLVECYQPAYLGKYQQEQAVCQCEFCQQSGKETPLVTLSWQEQIRQSADLGCETIGRFLLFDPEAFMLNVSQQESHSTRHFSEWDQAINQFVINLAVHPALQQESLLYAVGVLLSKAQSLPSHDEQSIQQLAELTGQLQDMAETGLLHEQLAALPYIESFQQQVLKELGNLPFPLDVGPLQSMSMALKQSELTTMSQSRLAESLLEIKQHWLSDGKAYFDQHPSVILNYFIHRFYHDVFPIDDIYSYSESYLQLVKDYFNLRALCCLWLQCDEELDEESVVAIFSAYTRGKSEVAQQSITVDNPLLYGMALLV